MILMRDSPASTLSISAWLLAIGKLHFRTFLNSTVTRHGRQAAFSKRTFFLLAAL
jgi:hypothetical protein